MASVLAGGGAVAVAASAAGGSGGAAAPAAAESKKEDKVEEKEESDDVSFSVNVYCTPVIRTCSSLCLVIKIVCYTFPNFSFLRTS